MCVYVFLLMVLDFELMLAWQVLYHLNHAPALDWYAFVLTSL
jgi:hypothetical protein